MDQYESQSIKLSDTEFQNLSRLIEAELGIRMPPAKKLLIQSRLQKRLAALNLTSFMEYYRFLTSPEGRNQEYSFFTDLVSTHVTHFFREESHFTYLYKSIMPDLLSRNDYSQNPVKVWSAAASSGEEPYTIAITLAEYSLSHPELGLDFEILGTDVSENIIAKSRMAVYKQESITHLSDHLKSRYFLRSIDKTSGLVKVIPAIRQRCHFKVLNLMDEKYSVREKFDIIFCRNVLIYFNKETQEKIIRKLTEHLNLQGYLILGHSETIVGYHLPLKTEIPTVFRKVRND